MRALLLRICLWLVALGLVQGAWAQDTGLPRDKVALRYRIEYLDKDKWKPVEADKKFKKDNTVRFRFMSNVAGTLYVLNTSREGASLQPVFPQGVGEGLRRSLGLGTHIEADHVGIFPAPDTGGGLRFTGVEGRERMLLVYVPDDLEKKRELMAIPAGAEGWDFDAETTYMATGDFGYALFHYFELKSK